MNHIVSSLIQYQIGDATCPTGGGSKIIAHTCNDAGIWGAGFVLAISKRWPEPEAAYTERNRKTWHALGDVQFIRVGPDILVANMIARHRAGNQDGPPIRYDALRACLREVAIRAISIAASVHMPRIGCGLAGGEWFRIEPLIAETLCVENVQVIVYDLASPPT